MAGEIETWLEGLGLAKYAETFAENEVDLEALRHLDEGDLRELGLPLGPRKKLLAAIEGLKASVADAAPTQAQQDRDPLQSAEGERRQVTVLFADLSGFTRLSSELGAEATHTLLNRYFEAVDGIVEKFGGSVDKHIGDNVMAVFGAPIAHTDDPQRAVRAALDIHQAMAGISETAGRPLEVHIGIASGQVVASGTGSDAHREYTVTGDSVNLASRLQDMAAAGETYISDAVQRVVGEFVTSEAVDEVAIKGFDRPVRVWRVQGLRTRVDEAGQRIFVGRRSELAQLAGVLSACRETGSGQTVHLRGEAGIGKTRLVEEFQRIAEQQGFACHTGLVLDFGVGKGQDAIRTLVRSLLGIPLGSGKKERAAIAEQAFTGGLPDHDRMVHLNDLLNLTQPAEMRALYDTMDNATRNRGKQETVAELVQWVSRERPVLIMIEDVHWADPVVLAYIARLAVAVTDCPAILMMTSRIEGDPINQAWRGHAGGSPLMTIDLAPLREAEALELAAEFLESNNRLAMTCIERAAGNPLFLDQLLRSAREAGDEDVPGSVQSLVQARMDRLEPGDRMALQAASVIGQRFGLDALRHLIGEPQYDCSKLVENFLVRPQGKDFLFAHALVRDGVYSSLLSARRQDLHRSAADWFLEQDPILHAEHLDRAEDPAAAQAYLDAARAQVSQFHHERAGTLAKRGLEIAGDATARYALTCLHGDVLRELGENDRSIEAFEDALDAAADDSQRSAAWTGQAEGMRILDRFDDALTALDKAQGAAQGQVEDLTRIHYIRGNIYFPLGNFDGCLEQHELALKFAREAGSVEDEARALGGLGDAYYQRGHMITAYKHFHRCVELSHEHGFGRIAVANLSMVGFSRQYSNELPQALENGRETFETAAKVGHRRAELLGRHLVFSILFEMGDIDVAAEQLVEADAIIERLGARRFEAQNLCFEAKVARVRGRRTEAVRLSQQAMAICQETGMGFLAPRVIGEIALSADDPALQRKALQDGENLLKEPSLSHNHFNFYRDAMSVCLDKQDWDEVERYAAALEEFTRAEPLPWCDFYIARGRALAAFGRGKRDGALIRELEQLRDEGEHAGLKLALPELDAALGQAS
jgi:class 3 adenylate cyclase/tetratricopeptide (TPR) repeat protein